MERTLIWRDQQVVYEPCSRIAAPAVRAYAEIVLRNDALSVNSCPF